jgi:uncharacterized membrane protein
MQVPDWALLTSFWLHMLTTVAWIGGLAVFSLLILPTVKAGRRQKEFGIWFGSMSRRLDSVGWFSMGLLTFTGLVQMDANPNYTKLFDISNTWAQAICLKHIAFGGMIGVSAYVTWGVYPAMARAALKNKGEQSLITRLHRLILANLGLGLAVLGFTALARIQ